jgi:hypothetical protein
LSRILLRLSSCDTLTSIIFTVAVFPCFDLILPASNRHIMSVSKVSPLQLLTAPVRLALFDPRVTAPLLIAILYYPEKLRSLLTIRLHPLISSPAFIKTLKVALGLGVLRGINNKLSQWVVNNWKSDANFVKSQEIVLISGGTSGIGKVVAEYFAKQGVKTVVLDINAPKEPLRKWYSNLFWTLSSNRTQLPGSTFTEPMSLRLLILLP